MNRETKRIIKTIILIILALVLLAGCGLLIWNAVSLHSAEVAEQIAKFGFYKKDVYLDYGRHCAYYGSIWGAIFCGGGAFVPGYLFLDSIFG